MLMTGDVVPAKPIVPFLKLEIRIGDFTRSRASILVSVSVDKFSDALPHDVKLWR